MLREILTAAAVSVAATAFGAGLWVVAAKAHEAPSGWQYSIQCCSNQDCSELPPDAVQEGRDGYVLRITPAMNSQLVEPKTFHVPYGDSRIRRDGQDGKFHACIGPAIPSPSTVESNRLICLYVPPAGF